MDTFFLPMRNPRVEHGNPTLQEYFLWNNLELAPVSAAAKRFVLNLKKLGVPPDEWRDRNSRPLLYVATNWNYLALAKWLVSQVRLFLSCSSSQQRKTLRSIPWVACHNLHRRVCQGHAVWNPDVILTSPLRSISNRFASQTACVQGVSVTAGGLGDRLVELAEQKGFTTMLDWLREQIAIAQAHTDDDDPEDPDDSR